MYLQLCGVFFGIHPTGYNENLDNLEKKVEGAAKDSVAESRENGSRERKIALSDVVAVFVTDWRKYVRASVKKRERNDLYSVWCIDYGVPMVVHASNIVNLPNAFRGMQLTKNERIVHTGGMENCLPAEKQINFAQVSSTMQKLRNWTPNAIGLMQKILDQAVKLEFEHVQDLSPTKKPHYFGRLMIQRLSDGEMIDVMEALLEMNMAISPQEDFKSELMSIESISQPITFTVNNELLDVKMCVVPFKTVSEADADYSSDDDEIEPTFKKIKLETLKE